MRARAATTFIQHASTVSAKALAAHSPSPWNPAGLRDGAALQDFLRRTSAWLRRLVPPWTMWSDMAWNAATETALAVLRAPGDFPSMRAARAHARSVIVHEAIKVRKRHARAKEAESALQVTAPGAFSSNNDAVELIWVALERIPEAYRLTVIATELIGMTAPELGELIGVGSQTVYNRKCKGLAMMKAVIEAELAK